MPSMRDHPSGKIVKMLNIGAPGAGKSGAICSLADAGLNVRILDLDKGADIIRSVMLHPSSIYKLDSIDRIKYISLSDRMKNVSGKLIPKSPKAWQSAMELLDNWKDGDESLGPISSWTANDVLVIDGLTHLCNAAMNFVLFMNARLGQPKTQGDWYQAQNRIEELLQLLYDDGVGCNVVMNCHIKYIGDDNGPKQGYPESVGTALAPKIGSYFNTVVMSKTSGSGVNEKHKIITKSNLGIELKNSNPLAVKAEYPIETGLADLFRDLRGLPAGANLAQGIT